MFLTTPVRPVQNRVRMRVFAVAKMDALGIALIVVGAALVCTGLIFWHRAPRTEPADLDGGELRALIDALEEEDQKTARGPMANVRPRLDQIRNEDSSK